MRIPETELPKLTEAVEDFLGQFVLTDAEREAAKVVAVSLNLAAQTMLPMICADVPGAQQQLLVYRVGLALLLNQCELVAKVGA